MKVVVITGSTRGIGLGLAQEFLKRDCAVFISSRSADKVTEVVGELASQYGAARVAGVPCDMNNAGQVQALWDLAKQTWGQVDIWINNAGITNTRLMLWELDAAEIARVVNTNVTGMMYGCQVALKGMLAQGSGSIYNFEGHGSNDMTLPGLSVYGATKRAVRYFTQSLVEEAADTPVRVGAIGPGMVVTDLLVSDMHRMSDEQREQARAVFNVLADTVETVTPWLAEAVLKDDKSGTWIEWLNEEKAQQRFQDEAYLERDLLSGFGL